MSRGEARGGALQTPNNIAGNDPLVVVPCIRVGGRGSLEVIEDFWLRLLRQAQQNAKPYSLRV
jgi:hypothetical protein